MKFIGNVEKDQITFARKKGSKDKMPRKKSGMGTAAKVGAGLAGADKVGGAAKSGIRSARRTAGEIGGTATLGKMAAGDAINAGRKKLDNARAGAMRSGYSAADSLRQKAKNFRNK